MKKHLQISLFSLCFSLSLAAQTAGKEPQQDRVPIKNRGCGTQVPSKEWNDAFNAKVDRYKQNLALGKATVANYTIPVIVHVLHSSLTPVGTFPNISYNQINSQIAVLNADFAGSGANVNNLAATAFSAVGAANCNISFCPATRNLLGQTLPEPGVDRINFEAKGWTNPASLGSTNAFINYFNTVIKPASIWDPAKYLNIWISDENMNAVMLLGYATFPANTTLQGLGGELGSATTDGVFCYAGCYGNVGFLDPAYNLGRTASHEIGHWLGLRHIGGDGNGNPAGDCTATDYCNDTPPQKGGYQGGQFGQNYGNPPFNQALNASSCGTLNPNGDMFMNFMDYCDDAALYMFTNDQRARMQTAMSESPYRSGLTASAASLCQNPASLPSVIMFMDASVCNTLGVISTTSQSTGNPIPTFLWSGLPAGVTFTPANNVETPSMMFSSAGVYTISCSATNSLGTITSVNSVTVEVCDVGLAKNTMLIGHISVQPNPSSGKVNVIVNLPLAQAIDISVTNVLGEQLISTKHNSVLNGTFEQDLSAYPAGIYFITIANGKEKVVKRLILNK